MIEAVRKTARGLTRDFGEVEELQVSRKGAADFVSAADLKAEQTLFEELTRVRPGYGFLGEERGEIPGTDKTHRWIVDPLDGTTNFLHAIPHFAINVALERDGLVVAGVTYNPVTHDMFWAERGRGAYLNDKRLRVSARSRLDEAIIATGIPFLGHGQHALAGPRLGRRGALRRLLGARPRRLGRGRGHLAGRRGRGHGHRRRWGRSDADRRIDLRGQRDPAWPDSRPPQGGRLRAAPCPASRAARA
jgi:myo-inositol-1(or 4)-monophosphatase